MAGSGPCSLAAVPVSGRGVLFPSRYLAGAVLACVWLSSCVSSVSPVVAAVGLAVAASQRLAALASHSAIHLCQDQRRQQYRREMNPAFPPLEERKNQTSTTKERPKRHKHPTPCDPPTKAISPVRPGNASHTACGGVDNPVDGSARRARSAGGTSPTPPVAEWLTCTTPRSLRRGRLELRTFNAHPRVRTFYDRPCVARAPGLAALRVLGAAPRAQLQVSSQARNYECALGARPRSFR